MEKSYVLCNGVRINFFEMFMRKNYRQTDKLEFVNHNGKEPLCHAVGHSLSLYEQTRRYIRQY